MSKVPSVNEYTVARFLSDTIIPYHGNKGKPMNPVAYDINPVMYSMFSNHLYKYHDRASKIPEYAGVWAYNILALIVFNNLTYETFATKIGATKSAVSQWINGHTNPDICNVISIARAFSVKTDDILGVKFVQDTKDITPESIRKYWYYDYVL